ncbi:alanyl-tRNA editing protein [Alkaliphilus metalliredigens]|uniref:alanyl-tRNA editing protein n=1 Tax=Alkaliphilus metalliredigens TaxID=208226 RepID=UPI0002D37952|nr:DHHA1 domain-containing protein [Alkaliphilus metalliredigens]
MQKKYYENLYEKEFTTSIINTVEKEGQYHVVLDETYFYPEGGGQPSDTGTIDSIPVIFVYEDETQETIYHVLEKKPNKLKRVTCSIDWNRRYDHMQQHLGQHLLSASIFELFNGVTVGFHLSEHYCTIDIDKAMNETGILEAEKAVNQSILDSRKVQGLFPTYTELKKLPLRKMPPQTTGQIRIVQIEGIDATPCCGTHPHSTLEVQLMKITKWEKYKGGTRIEFLCGSRAIRDYAFKHETIKKTAQFLSCNENTLLERTNQLLEELRQSNADRRSLQAQVTDYEVKDIFTSAESVGDNKIIKSIFNNAEMKQINSLASKLVSFPRVIVLFGIKSEDKAQLLFMRSEELTTISMKTLLRDAITLVDGKGGGSDLSAQGGGKNKGNLDSAIEYAYRQVKQVL